MTIRLILGFFLAYFLALVGTPMAREAALRFGVVDRPDGALKNHRQPVAYLGGLAVFVLITSGIMIEVAIMPWWLRLVITVVWLVGLSNAFNLVDIMDGLASGLGVISATFLLVVALLNGRLIVAAFTVALIGALLGFLRSNFYPATIYLGDCGSLFIGLTLGALAMVMDYTAHNPLGWLAPLYILAVPIIDTVYVTVLRIKAGRKVYYGSPDHFPLRMRKRLAGWTAGTVVVSYAVAVVFGAIGLVVLFLDPISTLVVTAVVGLTVIGVLIWLAVVPMES
jgi:UDP-GlcNAc:undecaprenyl-phosphate GlcNAc-1-phosphate transferase